MYAGNTYHFIDDIGIDAGTLCGIGYLDVSGQDTCSTPAVCST